MKLKEYMKTERPENWESIPDIDLYMDQVINYMERQHIGLAASDDENLTAAMINNYIKKNLLPRAKGKKYGREHIVYLTAICLLKQILSIDEIGEMMSAEMDERNVMEFYDHYLWVLDTELVKAADALPDTKSEKELMDIAMEYAVSAYANKFACKRILALLNQGDGIRKSDSDK